MKAYLLRNIPDATWIRVKRRAASEGRHLRYIVLKLLERYATHGWNGTDRPPDPPRPTA